VAGKHSKVLLIGPLLGEAQEGPSLTGGVSEGKRFLRVVLAIDGFVHKRLTVTTGHCGRSWSEEDGPCRPENIERGALVRFLEEIICEPSDEGSGMGGWFGALC
jgi:hypothetical protein